MPKTKQKSAASTVKKRSTKSKKNKSPKIKIKTSFWSTRRLPLLIFVVLFACVGAYFILTSGASSPTLQLKMTVKSTATNLCLDDLAQSRSSGSAIIDYGCNSKDYGQQWTLYSVGAAGNNRFLIKNPNSNICVDDTNDAVTTGPTNRKYVITWACNTGDRAQIWSWSNSMLKNAYNSGCINDTGSSLASGNHLIVYPCGGSGPTYWDEVAIAGSSGGGSGGGGGSCPTYNASTPAQAQADAKCLMAQSPWNWSPSTYWPSLYSLWQGESGWVYNVYNTQGSGACGIPQFKPCVSKFNTSYAPACAVFIQETTCQIKQGFAYIQSIYGNPYNANVYDKGHGGYIQLN